MWKRSLLILFCISFAFFCKAQSCLNDGFESMSAGQYTAGNSVPGWSLTSASSSISCTNPIAWVSGSANFHMVQTPIVNWAPATSSVPINIPHSPLGGTLVAQLNDLTGTVDNIVRLSQSFVVGNSNSLLQFAYAGSWYQCQSNCCAKTKFGLSLYDCNGTPISCFNLNAPECNSSFNVGPYWSNWQMQQMDLSAFIGTCVRIDVISQDCPFMGHRGITLFDVKCASQPLSPPVVVNFCSGSTQAQLTGPIGYSTYSWVAPPGSPVIPASQATLSSITVNGVIANSVYTLNMTNYSGCMFSHTYAIVPSSVSIVNTATASSCIGGTSGSATVIAGGSGSGYNYTWTSLSSNAVVGTNSVASGLAPGTYSVHVSSNTSGCGSASATVAIILVQQPTGAQLKPYCSKAFFDLPGATNVQWYNPAGAIAGSLGGTSPSYTLNNPCNNCAMYVRYTSAQGCQDSTVYFLSLHQPNPLTYNPLTESCPATNNATAVINISPLPSAIPGANTFSVWSVGASPSYSSTVSGSASYSYAASNLGSGTYSVYAFDGLCEYSGQFTVSPVNHNYTLSPQSSTVCPGQILPVMVSFSTPVSDRYYYSWSPNTFIIGSSTSSLVFMQPAIAAGPASTTVYSVIITPTAVFCPLTTTMSVTAINTPTPSISAIPSLCSNAPPYTVTVNPAGGYFQSAVTGTANPVDPGSGIITPSLANAGVNTFTYSISEFTCPVKTATASYHIIQTINASLNVNHLSLLCASDPPLNLMNFALNHAGSWAMPALPGFTASPLQGNIFTPAGLSTNAYSLTYTTDSSPSGCKDSATLVINVLNPPTPTIIPVNSMCTNALPLQMTASPQGGLWSGGPYISNTGEFQPQAGSAGPNAVQYAVGTGTCLNSSQINVKLETFVSAIHIKTPGPFCKESPTVDLNGFALNGGGEWFINGTRLQGSIFDPGTANTNALNTIVYKTYSVPTATLCPDSNTILTEVRSLKIPELESLTSRPCAPAEVVLSAQEVKGAKGTWRFDDGSPDQDGFSVAHFFGEAGIYEVSFGYIDDIGCRSPVKKEQVTLHKTPKPDFSFPEEIYTFNAYGRMINLSSEPDSNSYFWLVDQALKSPEKDPVLEFPSAGAYSVTLIASSIFDCSSEITKVVTVKNDFAVYIPNAFSPNADGLNDIFLPVFTAPLEGGSFRMEIFDRWGHSVYFSSDPDAGWNGAMKNKGEILKTGAYIYLMAFKSSDGRSFKKTGHVILEK